MTNDTNTRTKANAVFFAAIMVISMVAVGFAAAPAAAADANNGSLTFNDQVLDDGEVTVEDVETNGNATAVVTYTNSSGTYVAGTADANDSSTEDIQVTIGDEGGFPGNHTAWLFPATNFNLEAGAEVSGTSDSIAGPDYAIVADADAEVDGATKFQGQRLYQNVTGQFTDGTSNLELRSVDTSDSSGNTIGGLEQALTTEGTSPREFVEFDTEDLEPGVYAVTNQTRGDGIANETTFEIVTQDVSAEFDEDTVGNVNGEDEVDFEISSSQRNVYDVEVSAEGLDAEELGNIFTDSDAFDDQNVSEDSDDDIVTLSNAEGDHTLNFSDIDADEYEFQVEVTDTTAEDTDTVTVEDVSDGEVNIEEGSLNTAQGDVVEFNVTAEGAASSGTVIIGDEDDFGYQTNVSISDFGDDDQITLAFNTYTAGDNTTDSVSVVDTDDDDDTASVEYETNLTDSDDDPVILANGDYDISSVSSNSDDFSNTISSSDDVATLFIEERSTDGIQLWTASTSNADDITSEDDDAQLDAVTSAVEDGLITQTDTVSHNDVVVHQISANGIQGAIEAEAEASSVSEEQALLNLATNSQNGDFTDGESSIQLRIRETRASAGPNAQRETVVPTANNIDLIIDEENDDYYIVQQPDDFSSLDDTEDYEFEIDFAVRDERLVVNQPDDFSQDDYDNAVEDDRVSATLNIEEADASFDQDPYNVTNAENQSVTGTSNVAPGTEFTVRARSASGTQPSFVKTDDEVTVAADGTFSAEFDFSDTSVDDEYTLSVQQLGLNDDVEVDGTVVEQVQEPAVFEVSDLNPQDVTVTSGDAIDVSATVENTGGQEATQTVEFRVGGNAVDSQEVTLAGGNSTTVEFTGIDTSGLDAGEFEHGVFTDDDSQTATLTVEAADGEDGMDGNDTDGEDGTDGNDTDGNDTDGEDGATDDGTPGFGAIVALVALIAAALLATRRAGRNE